MSPTDLEEARRLFSLPQTPPETPQESTQAREMSKATQNLLADMPLPEGIADGDAMVVKMAIRAKKKYAVTNAGGDAVLLFGKHRAKKVSTLAMAPDGRDYLRWMTNQEFAPELQRVIREWLTRMI